MSAPQRTPSQPQRRFKPHAGIQRKTADERAASIQAEAARQANQSQPQASSSSTQPAAGGAVAATGAAQHGTTGSGRRTSARAQRAADLRIKNQNTGSVFGAAGRGSSSRGKNVHAVSGTEELVQRVVGGSEDGEGGQATSGGAGGEVDAKQEGKKAVASGEAGEADADKKNKKRAAGPSSKSTAAKKGEVVYVSEDTAEGTEGKPADIEEIERISISSGDDDKEAEEEDVDGDELVLSRRRRVNRSPRPGLGLRPVRAARDLSSPTTTGAVPNQSFTKTERKGEEREDANQADTGSGDAMEPDRDGNEGVSDVAMTARQTPPAPEDRAAMQAPRSPTKRRRKSSTKDANSPRSETTEERAERERYSTEVRKLGHKLFPQSSHHPRPSSAPGSSEAKAGGNGGLYLFQFPPLTPMLIDPATQLASQQQAKHAEVKIEATDNNKTLHAPQIQREKVSNANAKVMSAGNTGQQQAANVLLTTAGTQSTDANLPSGTLPAGQAGRLNLHKSGKVTMEWGCSGVSSITPNTNTKNGNHNKSSNQNDNNDDPANASMRKTQIDTQDQLDDGTTSDTVANLEVRWGTEVGFLQDVVLLGSCSDDADGDGDEDDSRGSNKDEEERTDQDEGADVVMTTAHAGPDTRGRRRRDKGKSKERSDGGHSGDGRKDGDVQGKAWALRQLQGKFVVVPDWARVFD